MVSSRYKTLSLALSGDEPPTEFRIFTAGTVETTKGVFTFDEASAKSVMTEYQTHGNDLMIDYDHASLASVSLDPAQSGKAAGWFNLEVRGGELWAVNVRWTPLAADALRRKEWRFMSPAFGTNENGQITDLLNVAITNLPATRKLQPLMAASMKPENVMAALEALISGDSEKCAELLKGIIAEAAGASAPEAPAEPPADAPADPAADPTAAADAPAEDPAKLEEELVAASAILRLSGVETLSSAVAQVELFRASHLELETERAKLAKERAILEGAERRKLCVELVSLAGRAPATVWASPDSQEPKAYLAAMPIADLRAMHADAVQAHGKKPATIKPPVASLASELSAREIQLCGNDPARMAKYAATRAGIKARNVNGTGV